MLNPTEGQKVHGTHKEQLSKLNSAIMGAIQAGAATPEEYRSTLLQLLKATEALRLKNESELLRIEKQTAHCHAVIKACSMFGAMILHIVDARTRERMKIVEGKKAIERRQIEEDKRHIEELRMKDKYDQADKLESDVKKREVRLLGDEAMEIGSKAENEATTKAVDDAIRATTKGKTSKSRLIPPNELVSNIVQESLADEPVDQLAILKMGEKQVKKRKKKNKN